MLIYKATSPSGKVYIGMTTASLEKRKKEHIRFATRYETPFSKAILKYGIENISWEIIDTAETLDQLKEKEKFYIQKFDSFNNGYNCTLGGEGVFGLKMSKKTRNVIAKKSKAQWEKMTNEQKANRVKNNLNYAGKNKIQIKDSLGNVFKSMTEAAQFHNLRVSTISLCIKHNYATRSKVRFEKINGR